MDDYVQKLINLASAALGNSDQVKAPSQLKSILEARNGFYAFESALHVLPSGGGDGITLEDWNAPSLWKDLYPGLDADTLLFAADVFGTPRPTDAKPGARDCYCERGATNWRFSKNH